MKHIITLFFLSFSLAFFAQTYKVDDEVNYFNGVDWLESQIIKVDGSGKYLVYTNRERTKTKWVTANDIEPFIKEAIYITQISVNVTESRSEYVYKVGDFVAYKNGDIVTEHQIKAVNANTMLELYQDSTQTTTFMLPTSSVVISRSLGEPEYKTIEKQVKLVYKINEEVEYFDGSNWYRGVIKNFNENSQIFIDNKWYDVDKIRKIKS